MKLVIVAGATGTGKSQLAFDLAKKLKCEIINFDSIQVYKDLNIGSAKPSSEILKKIKHHLIDVISPEVNFTAGDYRRSAVKILADLSVQHKFVVLVGGTGFYLNALLNGMFQAPKASQKIKDELQKEYEAKGIEALFEELKSKDPQKAAKLHINDHYRILRALEILRDQKIKPSEMTATDKLPYEYIKIGLRREKSVLKQSIYQRSEKMVDDGLIEEVKGLIKSYGPNLRILNSVGYKETREFIDKKNMTKNELIEKITTATMQLVKKQSTWFKRDLEFHWIDPDKENVLEKSLSLLDFSS